MSLTSTAKAAKALSGNYPKLMKFTSEATSFIVLMTEDMVGTVVETDGSCPLGEHSEGWFMERFEDYIGSVTLVSQ
jgi:hypothetical protein